MALRLGSGNLFLRDSNLRRRAAFLRDSVADDNKRTELVCTKVTERVALALNRQLAIEDRTMSDYLNRLIRDDLYGKSDRIEEIMQSTK